MTRRSFSLVLAAVLMAATPAAAAEIRVMLSGAFAAASEQFLPQFERETGHKVITVRGPSAGTSPDAIPARLDRGERADVVISSSDSLDALAQKRRVLANSRVDLVRSHIGMAVRAGVPHPDIRTEAALKKTLLSAKSIALSSSVSGRYLSTELFVRLGIADQMRRKSRTVDGEPVGAVVARGEAELGFQQYSELLPVPGIEYVGPLPEGAQRVTIFSAAIAAQSSEPAAARALIAFLSSPAASPLIERSGLEPIRRR